MCPFTCPTYHGPKCIARKIAMVIGHKSPRSPRCGLGLLGQIIPDFRCLRQSIQSLHRRPQGMGDRWSYRSVMMNDLCHETFMYLFKLRTAHWQATDYRVAQSMEWRPRLMAIPTPWFSSQSSRFLRLNTLPSRFAGQAPAKLTRDDHLV